MKREINWKVFLICFAIVFGTAFAGSLFTEADSSWYSSVKPSITPPNFVFPIVWNILFLLITISLYLAWTNSRNKKQKEKIILFFGLNLFLNFLWSVLFFRMQNPIASFVELIFLFSSIISMIFVTKRINKASFYLLIPYLLWVAFAGFLNYLIAFG